MNKKLQPKTIVSMRLYVHQGQLRLHLAIPNRWFISLVTVAACLLMNANQLAQLLQVLIAWLS